MCCAQAAWAEERRLRTDDEAIRTQATIYKEPVFFILK
jgi:hypothetical protein